MGAPMSEVQVSQTSNQGVGYSEGCLIGVCVQLILSSKHTNGEIYYVWQWVADWFSLMQAVRGQNLCVDNVI